jgi:WD40 repeat protein
MSDIFISYSRKDIDFAKEVVNALTSDGLDIWIDWEGIPKGEELHKEIYLGIERADVFLFFISPNSAKSKWCKKEIIWANKNHKRVIPILIEDVEHLDETKDIMGKLSKINWIYCRPGKDIFITAIAEILATIYKNQDWVKYHTKLQVKALEWERRKDKKDKSQLLRESELQEAERQLVRKLHRDDQRPTTQQHQYVLASRRHEKIRRLWQFAGLVSVMALIVVTVWLRNIAASSEKTAASEVSARKTISVISTLQEATNQASKKTATNAQFTSIANETHVAVAATFAAATAVKELEKQAVLTLSESLSALALSNDVDYTQALLLGVESYRTLERNELNKNRFPDELPILLQKVQKGPTPLTNPPSGTVWKVVYSQDGKMMASASQSVDLWNTQNPASPKFVLQLSNSQDHGARDVVFTPDNSKLIAGYWDGHIAIWDVSRASTNQVIEIANFFVYSDYLVDIKIALSRDGKILAVSGNGNLVLLNISNPKKVVVLYRNDHKNNNKVIKELFFFPAYQNYLAFVGDDNILCVWNIADPMSPQIEMCFEENSIYAVTVSQNGEYLILADSNLIIIYNKRFVKIAELPYLDLQGDVIYAMALNPIHDILFTASKGGTLIGWDISDPEHMYSKRIFPGRTNNLINMTVNQNGEMMALGGDSKIVLWDITEKSLPLLWEGEIPGSGISAIEYGPNRNLLAVGFNDGNINIWDVSSSTSPIPRRTIPFEAPVKQLAFNSDENYLAALFDQHLYIKLDSLEPPKVYGWNIKNLEGDPYVQFFLATNTSSFFAYDGSYVLVGKQKDDGNVYITPWDVMSNPKGPIQKPSLNITCPAKDMSLIAQSHLIAIVACSVQLWDFSLNSIPVLVKENLVPAVNPQSVAFNKAGDLLAVGNGDNSISVWAISANKDALLLSTIKKAHQRMITSIVFSNDGNKLASASDDRTIIMWDISDKSNPAQMYMLTELKQPVLNGGLFFSADNKTLISASQDDIIFWDIDPQSWIKKACEIAGRNFTEQEWAQFIGADKPYSSTCQ